ncbi:MAG TPA: amidohydrolase [Caulobacter sp.]|nr:amidohydrolase [Caulobacter sp.]
MNRRSFLLATATAAFAAPALAADEGFLMFGGPIHHALDGANWNGQGVVVRGGKVAFAGPLAEARALARGLPEIDLKGAAAYPGFMDSHVHLTGVGLREMTLNLDQVKSVAELVAAARAWREANPGTEPLTGRGWIETHWPEKRFPTRADLDAVSSTQPIVLERADGHAVVLNSAALRLAGIDRTTKDPAGGRIERDAAGEATGMLIDNAMGLIGAKLPPLSYARRKEALAKGTALYAARGWTRGVNMSTEADDVKALFELAAEGRLPIRVDAFMTPEDSGEVLRRGPYADPTGLVRVRGVKLYMDGALGSRGAALLKPYSDRPDTSGLLIAEHDATLAILKQALKVRAQVAIHAIGDRGNRLALDWIEEAFASDPVAAKAVTWRIEHAQIIDPADIPRFAKLGVVASMQPSHAIGDLYFAPARLGPDRLAGAYAWRSLMDSKARLAFGTDAPVEVGDPRIEFYAAVARKDLAGRSDSGWGPEQALPRRWALAALTSGAAAAVQAIGGDLVRSMPADITVFSRDILTIPEADVLTVKPLLTIVGGRIVSDRR